IVAIQSVIEPPTTATIAPAMSGHASMKLTPGSVTVTYHVATAHTTNAPTCAASIVAQRRTVAQNPNATVMATSPIAAVYTPRNSGAPPNDSLRWSPEIDVDTTYASPAATTTERRIPAAPNAIPRCQCGSRFGSRSNATTTNTTPTSVIGSANDSGYTMSPVS